ncbi:MAG: acetyltransferase [Flavipsychrobacter sp.]|nr:acetyltransferase [Flavipsychrobacter sp.]
MEELQLVKPVSTDYEALTELWEASVRATHDFLPESDIQYFKPLVRDQFLASVDLYALQDASGRFHGFLGVLDGKIEMLFVDPASRGKGCGKWLLQIALKELQAYDLDVNEQNPQAVGFYQKMGFEVVGRSPLDAMGKPYPILHMKYRPNN